MIFHYAGAASREVNTVQSWSCRWKHAVMMQSPHFGTLCRQSEAAVGLVVALVIVELVLVGVTMIQVVLARRVRGQMEGGRRKGGSPTPS